MGAGRADPSLIEQPGPHDLELHVQQVPFHRRRQGGGQAEGQLVGAGAPLSHAVPGAAVDEPAPAVNHRQQPGLDRAAVRAAARSEGEGQGGRQPEGHAAPLAADPAQAHLGDQAQPVEPVGRVGGLAVEAARLAVHELPRQMQGELGEVEEADRRQQIGAQRPASPQAIGDCLPGVVEEQPHPVPEVRRHHRPLDLQPAGGARRRHEPLHVQALSPGLTSRYQHHQGQQHPAQSSHPPMSLRDEGAPRPPSAAPAARQRDRQEPGAERSPLRRAPSACRSPSSGERISRISRSRSSPSNGLARKCSPSERLWATSSVCSA